MERLFIQILEEGIGGFEKDVCWRDESEEFEYFEPEDLLSRKVKSLFIFRSFFAGLEFLYFCLLFVLSRTVSDILVICFGFVRLADAL